MTDQQWESLSEYQKYMKFVAAGFTNGLSNLIAGKKNVFELPMWAQKQIQKMEN